MSKENTLSDKEIIALLLESKENLDIPYKKHKDYCMNFMKKISHNIELNKDIFHDALLVLCENVNKPGFMLKCSIQTYLNSICRNQILVRFKKESKQTQIKDEGDYDPAINDWFADEQDIKVEKISAIMKALEELKKLGGNCYEIITRYFYSNQKQEKIAFDMGYSNADNVKNQKSRCQKKLKELTFDILKKK